MRLGRQIIEWKEFWKIAEIGEIARRYFAMNSFDDVLMVLGILLAGFFGGIRERRVIITAAIGATIAATISGFWGAYLTETSERDSKIKSLERKVAVNLKKSPIGKAHRFAALVLPVVNSGADLLISLLIISPFMIEGLPIMRAYFSSILLAFIALFMLGLFLGRINREKAWKSGVKMVITGIVCAIIIFLVNNFIK